MDAPFLRSRNLLLKEPLGGGTWYEFTDEPPFPDYLGKKATKPDR